MKRSLSGKLIGIDWVSLVSTGVIALAVVAVLRKFPIVGSDIVRENTLLEIVRDDGTFMPGKDRVSPQNVHTPQFDESEERLPENYKSEELEMRSVELLGISIQLRVLRVSSGDAVPADIRNIEFFIRDGIRPRQLFPDNSQIVTGYWPLFHNNVGYGASTVRLLYQFVDSDSDGDGVLTHADRKTLAFSLPDGSNYRVLDRNVGDIADMSYLSESAELQLELVQQGSVENRVYSLTSGAP